MKLFERLWPIEPVLLERGPEPDEESGPVPGTARYEGNPELAVIESYALDVIGELSEEEIQEAESAVVELYGGAPDWRQAVRQKLGWSLLVDSSIADGWHRFRLSARAEGDEPEPAEFARQFADEVVRLSRS